MESQTGEKDKPLCHSERSDSAAEESSRRRIYYILCFARFLGKLGMTKKVGANQNPNAHTPSSHVIQSEAKPKRGNPRMERIIDLLMKIIMCE